jgi:hypothetical protein
LEKVDTIAVCFGSFHEDVDNLQPRRKIVYRVLSRD